MPADTGLSGSGVRKVSSDTIDPAHRLCDVCGEPLNRESDYDIRVLEIPYHAIEDIRKVDESIADELLQNNGRLTYHSGCRHPIHQYLPEDAEQLLVSGQDAVGADDNLAKCPVCDMPVLKSIGECGRCGKQLEEVV